MLTNPHTDIALRLAVWIARFESITGETALAYRLARKEALEREEFWNQARSQMYSETMAVIVANRRRIQGI